MAEVSKDGTTSGSATAIYTSPAASVTIISSLSGYAAADETITVYLDNGGAAAGSGNILEVIAAQAGIAWFCPTATGKRIAQGGKLYIATASGSTNWHLSGRTTAQSTSAESIG